MVCIYLGKLLNNSVIGTTKICTWCTYPSTIHESISKVIKYAVTFDSDEIAYFLFLNTFLILWCLNVIVD